MEAYRSAVLQHGLGAALAALLAALALGCLLGARWRQRRKAASRGSRGGGGGGCCLCDAEISSRGCEVELCGATIGCSGGNAEAAACGGNAPCRALVVLSLAAAAVLAWLAHAAAQRAGGGLAGAGSHVTHFASLLGEFQLDGGRLSGVDQQLGDAIGLAQCRGRWEYQLRFRQSRFSHSVDTMDAFFEGMFAKAKSAGAALSAAYTEGGGGGGGVQSALGWVPLGISAPAALGVAASGVAGRSGARLMAAAQTLGLLALLALGAQLAVAASAGSALGDFCAAPKAGVLALERAGGLAEEARSSTAFLSCSSTAPNALQLHLLNAQSGLDQLATVARKAAGQHPPPCKADFLQAVVRAAMAGQAAAKAAEPTVRCAPFQAQYAAAVRDVCVVTRGATRRALLLSGWAAALLFGGLLLSAFVELELAPLDPAQAAADATRRFKRERKKQVKAARAKAEAEHAKSVAMSTVFPTHTIQVTQEEMDAVVPLCAYGAPEEALRDSGPSAGSGFGAALAAAKARPQWTAPAGYDDDDEEDVV